MTRYAHITGWGMTTPEKVLSNDDLSRMVETDNDWIISRTGILYRHIAAPEQSTATLACEASIKAIQVAGLTPSEIDLIIVASSSPEHLFPATACLVQDRIGASKAGAFDLSAACTGFIYALDMATQAIRAGSINNALVIGSETLSRFVNWKDRETCILFGDGAGAFVLQGSDEPGGLISSVLRSDGSGANSLSIPAGGSRLPATMETVAQGMHFIQMNGREVFRFATRVMQQATLESVRKAGLKIEDIQLIIPHQANRRIIEAAARSLNFPLDRVMINVQNYGNTSTASIPIAACEAIQQGHLQPGEKVVLVGFGAGLTWGAATVLWNGPSVTKRKVKPSYIRFIARLRSLFKRIMRKLEGWVWGNS